MDGVGWWELLLALFIFVVVPLAVLLGILCLVVAFFTSLWKRRR
jgi:hypothetical protein